MGVGKVYLGAWFFKYIVGAHPAKIDSALTVWKYRSLNLRVEVTGVAGTESPPIKEEPPKFSSSDSPK